LTADYLTPNPQHWMTVLEFVCDKHIVNRENLESEFNQASQKTPLCIACISLNMSPQSNVDPPLLVFPLSHLNLLSAPKPNMHPHGSSSYRSHVTDGIRIALNESFQRTTLLDRFVSIPISLGVAISKWHKRKYILTKTYAVPSQRQVIRLCERLARKGFLRVFYGHNGS